MKVLIPILIGLLVVGCGESAEKRIAKEAVKLRATAEGKAAETKAAADANVIESVIRGKLKKPAGELTKADYEKVTGLTLARKQLTEVPKGLDKLTQLEELYLLNNQLTDVKGLEKLAQLKKLNLYQNELTEVPKGLEKLTELTLLNLRNNPDLTKAQIAELQKALPKCKIFSNPSK